MIERKLVPYEDSNFKCDKCGERIEVSIEWVTKNPNYNVLISNICSACLSITLDEMSEKALELLNVKS